MGGTGVGQPDCGSVGVFDPQSNALIKIIQARKSVVAKDAPYIMYPHGLSAYQDRLVITSTADWLAGLTGSQRLLLWLALGPLGAYAGRIPGALHVREAGDGAGRRILLAWNATRR